MWRSATQVSKPGTQTWNAEGRTGSPGPPCHSFHSVRRLEDALAEGRVTGSNLRLDDSRAREVHVLRARCAVGLKLDAMAQEDFCTVLRLDKSWEPDPVTFPRDEISVFEAARAGCVRAAAEPEPAEGGKPWYMKPVTWAAGGAVILAAVLLGGGGDDEAPDTTLSDFPDPPVSK